MKRSLNEVSGTLRRAACGAGYAIGLSEDISRAGMALIGAGLDGVAAVAGIMPEKAGEGLSHTALTGPSLFECLIAGEPAAEMQNVDTPLLLAGFALSAAENHESGFDLTFSDGTLVQITRHEITGNLPEPIPQLGVSVACVKADGERPKKVQMAAQFLDGIEINEECFPLLQRWARETCVPATEASRLKGAGAGLTDND